MSKKTKDNPSISKWHWSNIKSKVIDAIQHPFRFIKKLLIVTGAIVWTTLISIIAYFYLILADVPELTELGNEQAFEQVKKSATGKVQIAFEQPSMQKKYQWVELNDINRDLLYAIVMSEDGTYFSHSGVNWDALINAMAENIKQRSFSYGASTITQQVAKNVYLSEAKTFSRKLTELFTSWELEESLKKNQILEVYLNVIEFGPDIYGVGMASQYYFKKPPSKINAAEGAFLAVLMPSPRKYHYSIFQNKHLAARHKRKIRRILNDMSYKEYISPKQYQAYLRWDYF